MKERDTGCETEHIDYVGYMVSKYGRRQRNVGDQETMYYPSPQTHTEMLTSFSTVWNHSNLTRGCPVDGSGRLHTEVGAPARRPSHRDAAR